MSLGWRAPLPTVAVRKHHPPRRKTRRSSNPLPCAFELPNEMKLTMHPVHPVDPVKNSASVFVFFAFSCGKIPGVFSWNSPFGSSASPLSSVALAKEERGISPSFLFSRFSPISRFESPGFVLVAASPRCASAFQREPRLRSPSVFSPCLIRGYRPFFSPGAVIFVFSAVMLSCLLLFPLRVNSISAFAAGTSPGV